MFAGLDIMMRVRGWTFLGECSGPEALAWIYGPSDAGESHLGRGLEPVPAIASTLDRPLPTDTVDDCEVEVRLVGTHYSQTRLTGLTGLTPHLKTLEADRACDPIPPAAPAPPTAPTNLPSASIDNAARLCQR
ncbi:hypothetical protein IU450_25890 [Nocardia abscessus]|uniref:hypothetical protein n=1 Tax=Nocardia abscessus TaxID=120957 RepID=UPI001894C839|nr:hypothetical protein [Nocardia abscessus]MBF6339299.1 hypothetical protein [Nocardia abscessus]